jgi:hypothetical protein
MILPDVQCDILHSVQDTVASPTGGSKDALATQCTMLEGLRNELAYRHSFAALQDPVLIDQ